MEVNETILKFKLNVVHDLDLRENAYNYVLRIKSMSNEKILADIGLYMQCKEQEKTELRIVYAIVLEYLNSELQFRSLL